MKFSFELSEGDIEKFDIDPNDIFDIQDLLYQVKVELTASLKTEIRDKIMSDATVKGNIDQIVKEIVKKTEEVA